MKIPLETKLHITFRSKEDKYKAEILAVLVDRKVREKNYAQRIEAILNEAMAECMREFTAEPINFDLPPNNNKDE